jgi:NAD-dependent deacetylase
MIEKAAMIAKDADLFVVVGTSLVVYPAAGLLNYVSNSVSKFIIDRKIPPVNGIQNLTSIEMTATEGVKELGKLLAVDI